MHGSRIVTIVCAAWALSVAGGCGSDASSTDDGGAPSSGSSIADAGAPSPARSDADGSAPSTSSSGGGDAGGRDEADTGPAGTGSTKTDSGSPVSDASSGGPPTDAAADSGGTAASDSGRPAVDAGTSSACTWRTNAAETVATPFAAPDDSLTFTPPTIPCVVFSIASYGAKADGTTMNTTAFSQAVAAATAAGGGVVDVPTGTWLTGAIHLASNVELHLEAGATITFSASASDYLPAVPTRWEGLDVLNYSPFVYALDATNVAITGTGALKGPGSSWGGGIAAWSTASKTIDADIYKTYYTALPKGVGALPSPPNAVQPGGAPGLRPTMIECNGCTNFLVDGPTITAPAYWVLHPLYSSNVIIRNVHVDSTATTSNGDGTDPDSCTNCLIENVSYATSDDNIAVKSGLNEDGIAVGKPSHNIVVRNVTSTTGHGGVTIGSEMSGGVSNVFATGSSFMGVQAPMRVKTLDGRGGTVSGIFYDHLTIGWTSNAMNFTTQYNASTVAPHDTSLVPTVRGISASNVTGTGSAPVYGIVGPMSGITLTTINLKGSGASSCANATGVTLSGVTVDGAAVTAIAGCP